MPKQKPSGTSKGRVAICFFGLTRSLTFTYDAIYRSLIKPINDAGYEVRC